VMQRYAPEIERGNKKKTRLEAGANYPDTLHRTVKQLHEELPMETAALETEIAAKEAKITEQMASLEKTQKHLEKLKAKKQLTEKEIKRKETYHRRLEKKQAEMALALNATMEREVEAIEEKREAVRLQWQKAQEQTAAARRAKESYEMGVNAIEAVLSEAENETLVFDADTGKTTMRDPTLVKAAPPKIRTQVVKLAKRLAFLENNLFARIFRLDEHIGRIRAFLLRPENAPETQKEAQEIVDDAAEDDEVPLVL